MRTSKVIVIVLLVALALTPAAALATLAKFGPINTYIPGAPGTTGTGNGYPKYYMDQNGVAVDLPVPPFAAIDPSLPGVPFGNNFVAPMMIFDEILSPGLNITQEMLDYSATIGFGTEAFYFVISPDPKSTTFAPPIDANDPAGGQLGRFNSVIGLEAAFATVNPVGLAKDGEQAVFQRIRFNWFAAPDGFYKFTHPYGTELMAATGGGGLRYTIDTGVINIAPFNFSLALTGKIGPFLFQVNPPPVTTPVAGAPPIPPPYSRPQDWLGDGATAATFTGSPTGFNGFRLEAFQDQAMTIPLNLWPIFPGGNTNVIETNLGVISGHRFHFPPIIGAYELLLLED